MSIIQENLDRLPAREGVRENLHELCSKLVSRVPEIHQIYVFGSQARGDWNEYSDIDIFIIVDKSLGEPYVQSYVSDIVLDITRYEDNFLVMPKSVYGEPGNIVEQFKDIYTIDFLWNVEKDGVLIYDSDK